MSKTDISTFLSRKEVAGLYKYMVEHETVDSFEIRQNHNSGIGFSTTVRPNEYPRVDDTSPLVEDITDVDVW